MSVSPLYAVTSNDSLADREGRDSPLNASPYSSSDIRMGVRASALAAFVFLFLQRFACWKSLQPQPN
jgi:hypothetical protein